MDEKQLKQTLEEIAAEAIPAETNLWSTIETAIRRGKQRFTSFPVQRLVATGLAIPLLAAAIFYWVNLLPQTMTLSAPPEAQPLPENITAVLPPATFPNAPDTLPRYRVYLIPPSSPASISAWVANFGWDNLTLFRDPRSEESLIAVGADDSRLLFPHGETAVVPISYLSSTWKRPALGETINLEAGFAAAESFLATHNLLPVSYQLRDLPPFITLDSGYPPRHILVSPDLDGYALFGTFNNAVGHSLLIDPAGTVLGSGFQPADLAPAEAVAIRPAIEVVEGFANGRLQTVHLEQVPLRNEHVDSIRYYPPLPQHTIGQALTIVETDDTHFLVAEDGSDIRATLHTTNGASYTLQTLDLAQIVAEIEHDELVVSGTLTAQLAPDRWELEVSAWEIIPQQDFAFSGCAVGFVERDATGEASLVAVDVLGKLKQNGRYHIPNLPSDIAVGDHIEVCSERMREPSETLLWQIIYAPPRRLRTYHNSITPDDTLPEYSQGNEEYTLVIEQVELGYYFDPTSGGNAAEPVWVVSGHDADRQRRFIAYLLAY